MSDDEARQELAAVAASLRAYLEWQESTGATGVPRMPRSPSSPITRYRAPEALQHAEPQQLLAEQTTIPTPVTFARVASPAPSTTSSSTTSSSTTTSVPARSLPVIAKEVSGCVKCRLSESRTNTVFSRGSAEAKLCFVGEAPGADEDERGLPFVGRAGQLLDRMILAMGLDPEKDVYICNIIKCRPPNNRRPEPDEIATCIPYLHEQLSIVDPKAIVALGNTAVGALLGTTLGITKVRGQWKLYRGKIPVMPTYHPSYLLRPGPQQATAKKQAWDDLQAVMRELGLEPKKRRQPE
ncbi:MAG: uracil-DNA glycosylase [Polyangiaceae bacterium]|nr:uracil-DNA glycosylase [Polyangiaceae bacterium]